LILEKEALNEKCESQAASIKKLKSKVKTLTAERDEFEKDNNKKKQKLQMLEQ
jgi:outer membrane murein-binding lipoprotein Lpp